MTRSRRTLAFVLVFAIGCGLAAGLGQTLTSCAGPGREQARPLSTGEARRLAGMRVQNYRDGRTGLRAQIGTPGKDIQISGWVDWTRPLAYLAVTGPGTHETGTGTTPVAGLVQATPGLIATLNASSLPAPHPQKPGAFDGGPPAAPPADGWRVRAISGAGGVKAPLDTFAGLLFLIAAENPDVPGLLARSDARWLGREKAAGVNVDVLLGPAIPPAPPRAGPVAPSASPAPAGLAANGGAIRYWLDRDARLRRLEALLAANLPVRVDFQRDDRPELTAVAGLGGAPVAPRAVTAAEAKTLAGLRQRDLTAGGGQVRITMPAGVHAEGWLDWRLVVAYLVARDADRPKRDLLVLADRTGRASRPAVKVKDGLPPVPPPTERKWDFQTWAQRGNKLGSYDFDLLVGEALGLAGGQRDDAGYLAKTAVWLRSDVVGATPVTVYEIPKPAEKGIPKGSARLRYWVDKSGLLRRLEVRARTGGFGQLDLTPGPPPKLAKR